MTYAHLQLYEDFLPGHGMSDRRYTTEATMIFHRHITRSGFMMVSVAKLIRDQSVFTGVVQGNPAAEVEVRHSPSMLKNRWVMLPCRKE